MKRVSILLILLMVIAPCIALARAFTSSGQDESRRRTSTTTQTVPVTNGTAKVSLKLEPDERITLRNRFGPIIVTGVGGDTLEANAVIVKQGTGNIKLHLSASRSARNKVMVATGVAEKETPGATGKGGTTVGECCPPPSQTAQSPKATQPKPPAQASRPQPGAAQGGGTPASRPRPPRIERPQPAPPPAYLRGVGEIRLEVRLPRNAHIELIDSRRYAIITSGNPNYLTNTRNDVAVTNMETPVAIISSGDVQASKVGALEVRTRAGNISATDVAGPIYASSSTGIIIIKEAGGDVRATSISGSISIECARGRIEANTANGIITLSGIGGDLEASTTGGTITYTGAIRENGRYKLRSMSGQVRMLIQPEPPGFQASVSSYKGQVQVDFPLKSELSSDPATNDLPGTQGQTARRMTGRFGDGQTRINLDSFSGTVQLSRASSEALKRCR